MRNVIGVDCHNESDLNKCNLTEIEKIESYRNKANSIMTKFVKINPKWGIFAISCVDHV